MNLLKRIIVSLFLIPLVLYVILMKDPYYNIIYRGFIMIILAAASFDFIYSHKKQVGVINKILTITALLILVNSDMSYSFSLPAALLGMMVLLIITLNFLLLSPIEFYDKTKLLFSTIIYLGVLGLHFNLLAKVDSLNSYSGKLVVFVIVLNWVCDSGAFFVGKSIGRRKLAPVISPNKTIEGFIGGILTTIVYAIIYRHFFLPDITVGEMLLLSIVLAVICALGDLCASAIKRATNIKNYSDFIPGHGGIMDRLDSVLYTVTFTAGYFIIKEKLLKFLS